MGSDTKALGNGRKDYQQKRLDLVRRLKLGVNLERALTEIGYSDHTKSKLRHDPEIRDIVRKVHANQFLDLVPLAVKGMRECLESDNERVKGDMSRFVLKESGTLAVIQQAEKEGRQPTTEEIVAATSRLESLLQGAKQAQARDERVIEHEQDQ